MDLQTLHPPADMETSYRNLGLNDFLDRDQECSNDLRNALAVPAFVVQNNPKSGIGF